MAFVGSSRAVRIPNLCAAPRTAPRPVTQTVQRGAIRARAENEDVKVAVADVLKTGVKGVAWAIEQGTELATKAAPDDWDRDTVALGVKVLAVFVILSVAQNVISFAFTLIFLAAAAVIAVSALNLDVNEILDAAKIKTKK